MLDQIPNSIYSSKSTLDAYINFLQDLNIEELNQRALDLQAANYKINRDKDTALINTLGLTTIQEFLELAAYQELNTALDKAPIALASQEEDEEAEAATTKLAASTTGSILTSAPKSATKQQSETIANLLVVILPPLVLTPKGVLSPNISRLYSEITTISRGTIVSFKLAIALFCYTSGILRKDQASIYKIMSTYGVNIQNLLVTIDIVKKYLKDLILILELRQATINLLPNS